MPSSLGCSRAGGADGSSRPGGGRRRRGSVAALPGRIPRRLSLAGQIRLGECIITFSRPSSGERRSSLLNSRSVGRSSAAGLSQPRQRLAREHSGWRRYISRQKTRQARATNREVHRITIFCRKGRKKTDRRLTGGKPDCIDSPGSGRCPTPCPSFPAPRPAAGRAGQWSWCQRAPRATR